MRNKLQQSLDQVQASEALKDRTKAFLYQKTNGYVRVKKQSYRYFVPAIACLVLALFGAYWFYFTSTVEISIDINPSIELGVNRFDRVVSVEAYNDDGQVLASSLDIKNMNYADAVDEILKSDTIASLLSADEIMTIGVVGDDTAQSSEILSDLESQTADEGNVSCYYAQRDEVEAAHDLGLSYGKYRMFVQLQALGSNLSAEEVSNMTMRELRDLLNTLSAEEDETVADSTQRQEESRAGYRHGQDHENGKKQSNDT